MALRRKSRRLPASAWAPSVPIAAEPSILCSRFPELRWVRLAAQSCVLVRKTLIWVQVFSVLYAVSCLRGLGFCLARTCRSVMSEASQVEGRSFFAARSLRMQLRTSSVQNRNYPSPGAPFAHERRLASASECRSQSVRICTWELRFLHELFWFADGRRSRRYFLTLAAWRVPDSWLRFALARRNPCSETLSRI